MEAFFSAMGWPLALCAILGGLQTYLGQGAIERRAAFAGLAVAQCAALGSVWGLQVGLRVDADPWALRGCALAFALTAAGFFARQVPGEGGLSREALAGVVYVLAAASTPLVAAGLHHGAEEVAALVGGRALFARPQDVAWAALLCAALGALLRRLGREALGTRPGRGQLGAVARDLASYGALAAAASFAVPLVGVLLVFAQMVMPAATGALLASTRARRLWIGWATCTAGTLSGFAVAYIRDLPPEPVIVFCLGLGFALAAVARYLGGARDRLGAALGVLGSAALAAIVLALSFRLRAREPAIDLSAPDAPSGAQAELVDRLPLEPGLWQSQRAAIVALLAGNDAQVRAHLLDLIAARGELALLPEVHALLRDPQDLVRESALRCIGALGRPESVPALVAAARVETDDFLRIDFARARLALESDAGRETLLDVMEQGQIELARSEAYQLLLEGWPQAEALADPAFDPAGERAARAAAVSSLRAPARRRD